MPSDISEGTFFVDKCRFICYNNINLTGGFILLPDDIILFVFGQQDCILLSDHRTFQSISVLCPPELADFLLEVQWKKKELLWWLL